MFPSYHPSPGPLSDVRGLLTPCYLVIIPHQVRGLLVLSEPLDGGADLVGEYKVPLQRLTLTLTLQANPNPAPNPNSNPNLNRASLCLHQPYPYP